MSAPVTRPGNAKAAQQGKGKQNERAELGDGHVMGNLTADPELRYTPSGRAVTKLRVAYTPRIKAEKDGAWKDGPVEYYDLQVWGEQGERAAETLEKGDRIVACGTWSERKWEDREGQERTTIELTVRDIGPSMLFRDVRIKRTERRRGNGAGE